MGTIARSADSTIPKLEDQLARWGAKLDVLLAKGEAAGREVKLDTRKQIDEIKAKLVIARAKLDEAKTAGAAGWDRFKEGLEIFWKDLEGAVQKVTH